MNSILPKSFYQSDDVVQIANDLLGKIIITKRSGVITSGRIVETEAYRAPDDKACHAYNNLRTPRTETMFREGGVAYIYLCYGIHHLFNVVTAPEGKAHAVLIRGVEPIDGIDTMLQRRDLDNVSSKLTAGPGSLTTALNIRKPHNGAKLYDPKSPITIHDDQNISNNCILASARVGVGYAEECADWPWRFRIKDSRWTSPAK